MSDDPSQRPPLSRKCYELVSGATEIVKGVTRLKENADILEKNYSADTHSLVSTVYESTQTLIGNEQKKLLDMFTVIENLIHEREANPPNFELPSLEELHEKFFAFTQTPLPVFKGSQVPPLCGAMPFPVKEKIIPEKSYACTKSDDVYILVYVIGFDPEEMVYHCCDADPEPGDLKELIIPVNELIPMPTTAPARRTKATTFNQKARVLGLWPQTDGSGFTSVFYPATVKGAPSNSTDWYKLVFDETSNPVLVPEKLIVKLPE